MCFPTVQEAVGGSASPPPRPGRVRQRRRHGNTNTPSVSAGSQSRDPSRHLDLSLPGASPVPLTAWPTTPGTVQSSQSDRSRSSPVVALADETAGFPRASRGGAQTGSRSFRIEAQVLAWSLPPPRRTARPLRPDPGRSHPIPICLGDQVFMTNGIRCRPDSNHTARGDRSAPPRCLNLSALGTRWVPRFAGPRRIPLRD